MPRPVLGMEGTLRLRADGASRTTVEVRGEIFFLGGLTIPFGIGNHFADSMIERAVETGNAYLTEATGLVRSSHAVSKAPRGR
jgi:hypothetical protein